MKTAIAMSALITDYVHQITHNAFLSHKDEVVFVCDLKMCFVSALGSFRMETWAESKAIKILGTSGFRAYDDVGHFELFSNNIQVMDDSERSVVIQYIWFGRKTGRRYVQNVKYIDNGVQYAIIKGKRILCSSWSISSVGDLVAVMH
jgi:hypothetical protein